SRVWVAWTEYEGELRLARSEDGGKRFEPALHISGSAEQPTRAPALVMLADERIVMAWTYGEESDADVQLAVSIDHGASFEVLGPALRREGHADAPHLATDEQGGVHLVFAESPSGPGGPARLVYVRSDDDLVFTAPRILPDLTGSDQIHAGFPQLLTSGSNLVVNWEILHSRSRRSLGMGMIHSDDLGESFGQPQMVPGTEAPDGGISGGLQGLLMRKTAVGTDGQLLFGHSHFVPDQRSEVLLLRGQLPRH
ncbi:MAG: sialidase family protein, partial [Wenzhouxiangella sp.]